MLRAVKLIQIFISIVIFWCMLLVSATAQPLFKVTDDSDRVVFGVYNDGIRVMSPSTGDTIMTASGDSIRFNLGEAGTRALSRTFSIGSRTTFRSSGNDYFHVSPNSDVGQTYNGVPTMLWYPLKEAFRVGNVLITDPSQVGFNSMASGYQSQAVGNYSQAFGYQAIAGLANVDSFATAIGNNAQATGQASFAAGTNAIASGVNSFAFGEYAIASGEGSYAFGSIGREITWPYNSTGLATEATQPFSFAFGLGAKATRPGALAIGANVVSNGDFAVAIGPYSSASSDFATALGRDATAGGYESVAVGVNANASGPDAAAIGHGANATQTGALCFGWGTASGNYSIVIGGGEAWSGGAISIGGGMAGGNNSIAMGSGASTNDMNSVALGNGSQTFNMEGVAIGRNCKARVPWASAIGYGSESKQTYSTSIGYNSIADGQRSTAIGYWAEAKAYASTVIGPYNVIGGNQSSWIATDTLFVVGNGQSAATRSNALTLLKNGDLEISGPNAVKPGGTAWTNPSDRRLKEDIQPLRDALNRLLQLRGVTYKWKEPEKFANLTGPQMGMIAQEVEEIFPEWVDEGPDGYKLLSISGFEALTVEALRELKAANEAQSKKMLLYQTENEELKKKMSQLELENSELKERLAKIESILQELNMLGSN